MPHHTLASGERNPSQIRKTAPKLSKNWPIPVLDRAIHPMPRLRTTRRSSPSESAGSVHNGVKEETMPPEVIQARSAEALDHEWATDPRWQGVSRSYGPEDVVRLRGQLQEEHTLARR